MVRSHPWIGPDRRWSRRAGVSVGPSKGVAMTKAELTEEVAKVARLTKKEPELIVNSGFDNITDALGKGDKVELRGFGSFRIRHRNSRKGRNPKTGDSVSVPEKRVPFFKVGKRLRELVNT